MCVTILTLVANQWGFIGSSSALHDHTAARAAGITELEILVDTREQYPYRFLNQQDPRSVAGAVANSPVPEERCDQRVDLCIRDYSRVRPLQLGKCRSSDCGS
jgi:hypothetical protein